MQALQKQLVRMTRAGTTQGQRPASTASSLPSHCASCSSPAFLAGLRKFWRGRGRGGRPPATYQQLVEQLVDERQVLADRFLAERAAVIPQQRYQPAKVENGLVSVAVGRQPDARRRPLRGSPVQKLHGREGRRGAARLDGGHEVEAGVAHVHQVQPVACLPAAGRGGKAGIRGGGRRLPPVRLPSPAQPRLPCRRAPARRAAP